MASPTCRRRQSRGTPAAALVANNPRVVEVGVCHGSIRTSCGVAHDVALCPWTEVLEFGANSMWSLRRSRRLARCYLTFVVVHV